MGAFLFPPLEPLSVIKKSHTDFQVAMVKEIPTGHFDFRLFLLEIRGDETRQAATVRFLDKEILLSDLEQVMLKAYLERTEKVLFVRAPDFYDLKEIIEIAKRAEINRLWLLHE